MSDAQPGSAADGQQAPPPPVPGPPAGYPGYPADPRFTAPPASGRPPGYPAAYGAPPPTAYAPQAPAPAAFASPYATAAPATAPVWRADGRRSGLGVVALVLALLAVVVTPAVGAVAAYPVGQRVGEEILLGAFATTGVDLSVLSPVRGWVLVGEIAFWVGTVLGTWALVQGIVAIVRARGRGPAIGAVVVAALGPIVFGVAVYALVIAGVAAGTVPGT